MIGCRANRSNARSEKAGARGSALLDALIATVLLAIALLASVGVIQSGLATASRASWIRLSVSATRDVVDSLSLVGTRVAGLRRVPPVTVRWTPVGGGLFRFEAFAPDTFPPPDLVMFHDVPASIP